MSLSVLASLALALTLCAAQSYWPVQTYKTEKFSAPILSVKKYGETAPGQLFLGPYYIDPKATSAVIMEDNGELVWRPDSGRTRSYNVNAQMLNGEQVLTYWTGSHGNAGYGYGYGGVHILSNNYTKLYHVCGANLPITTLHGVKPACLLDSHESRITDRGSILVTARSVVQGDLSSIGGHKNGWILDSVFYELDIKTEKVLTRWSTWEHRHQFPALTMSRYPLRAPVTQKLYGASPDAPWDFAHMNSVAEVPAPAGGFIVSCRYLCSAIKLDKLGNVEWYLDGMNGGGSFTLPASGNFSFQHDILTADVTQNSMNIHLFDNANDEQTNPQRPSSGLLLHLDTAKMEATTLQRFSPVNETISTRTGGFEALPWKNHYLVDFGHPPIFNEFDGNGNVVWAASVGPLDAGAYRAYKKIWKGYPKTTPKVVGEHVGSKTTHVWVSWNGATEVNRWEVFGRRNANDSLRFVETVPKDGFETLVKLGGKYSHVQVNGMHGDGSTLGQSPVMQVQLPATSSARPSFASGPPLLALAVAVLAVVLC